MADLKKTVEILFEGNDQASRKAADVIAQIKDLDKQAGLAAGNTDKLGTSLDNVGKKQPELSAAAEALKAIVAALVLDKFVDVNEQVERFEKAIKAIKGSSHDTAEELKFVSDVANAVGVSALAAADGYVKLTAATKDTRLEGEPTRDIFEAVVKAMSALSRPTSDVQGVFKALTDMVSKGNVQMEELRGQLGDRLPGVMRLAAEAMGMPTAELEKLIGKGELAAEDFLPKFASALNNTFGGATFEGYSSSLNRLRNTIDQMFIDIGKAGAFDLLIGGIKSVTAVASGSIASIKLFGELIGSFMLVLSQANTGDNGIFSADWAGFGERAKDSLDKAAESTKDLLDAFSGAGDAAGKAKDAITNGMGDAKKPTKEMEAAARDVDKALKGLGVNPNKVKAGTDEVLELFDKLAKNPAVKGTEILAGLKATLKDLKDSDDIAEVGKDVAEAYEAGKLTAGEFAEATRLLGDAQKRLSKDILPDAKKAADEAAKAQFRLAEQTRKAEESAQKFRLEMEKIASNERIKIIEATVTLDVAKLEAQTKQVEAAFTSINETIGSTGDLLDSLFGLFKDEDKLSFRALHTIEKQIDLENQRRQEALNLQKDLVRAQIENLRAQTQSLNRGNPLIQIDGTGLQPHLEAFMWEILKAIQVRVNEDGLDMLLGTH